MGRKTKSNSLELYRIPGTGISPNEVELGSVTGVFGVHGEVRLYLHNPNSFLVGSTTSVVLLSPSGDRYDTELSVRRGAGKRILGKLSVCVDRDHGSALSGWHIALREDALPSLNEGEYYHYQLIGSEVFVDNQRVGTVTQVHTTEASDVLEIQGSGEVSFVAILKENVSRMDLEARRIDITVNSWEEGQCSDSIS